MRQDTEQVRTEGLPLLGRRGLMAKCNSAQVLRNMERLRSGLLSSLNYRSLVQGCLLTSHVMSNITLDQKEQVSLFSRGEGGGGV